MSHYLGKGVNNHNGLGSQELDVIKRHTMKSAKRISTVSTNRGLFTPSSKQLILAKVGPGTYEETHNSFGSRSCFSAKKTGHFGTASRDTHWSKYASEHSALVSKGIY